MLMPAFNAETTVRAAAESTLRSMPKDSELVVIDDASSDRTSAILESIPDRRIRVIRAATNRGVARTLQQAMRISDSEYVARMDADDYSLPWRFRKAIKPLEAGLADLSFSTVIVFSKQWLRPTLPVRISPEAMGLHLLLVNPVAHPTMVGRRSVIESVGGYRSVPSEDYDLWMRVASAGYRIERQSWPGLLYRRHPHQMTAQKSWQESAARNSETANAHAMLTKSELGHEYHVYSWLRGDAAKPESSDRFYGHIRASASTLDFKDKLQIMRLIREVNRR